MKKWGQVFVLTGSIVAMLITGTGCSKKNTGIKNEKLASDYMELFNMSEGIRQKKGALRSGTAFAIMLILERKKQSRSAINRNAGIYRKQKILIQNVMR